MTLVSGISSGYIPKSSSVSPIEALLTEVGASDTANDRSTRGSYPGNLYAGLLSGGSSELSVLDESGFCPLFDRNRRVFVAFFARLTPRSLGDSPLLLSFSSSELDELGRPGGVPASSAALELPSVVGVDVIGPTRLSSSGQETLLVGFLLLVLDGVPSSSCTAWRSSAGTSKLLSLRVELNIRMALLALPASWLLWAPWRRESQ
jgi:hypothetical protein